MRMSAKKPNAARVRPCRFQSRSWRKLTAFVVGATLLTVALLGYGVCRSVSMGRRRMVKDGTRVEVRCRLLKSCPGCGKITTFKKTGKKNSTKRVCTCGKTHEVGASRYWKCDIVSCNKYVCPGCYNDLVNYEIQPDSALPSDLSTQLSKGCLKWLPGTIMQNGEFVFLDDDARIPVAKCHHSSIRPLDGNGDYYEQLFTKKDGIELAESLKTKNVITKGIAKKYGLEQDTFALTLYSIESTASLNSQKDFEKVIRNLQQQKLVVDKLIWITLTFRINRISTAGLAKRL